MIDTRRCLSLLTGWSRHAERYWYAIPGQGGLGCYGSGYNSWGVQTNQKYVAAMAALASSEAAEGLVDRQWARDRALAALRFSLASHVSGEIPCTDGTPWGHTWISGLGIERMMCGVHRLARHLTDADRAALKRVLTSEADYLLSGPQRGKSVGIVAGLWGLSGLNVPESNIWNGAIPWRAAVMYPDEPHAADWAERAHAFLINGVSVEADAGDDTVVAGKPVRERHVGPNFFPNFALDHHGYFNLGYMVICASNLAMLHFDLKAAGLPRPESLDHHAAELWDAIRRMLFADGRLARLGGDTRVRYAYCQEYLLPTLLWAADRLGERHAAELIEAQLTLIEREARYNGDGGFYSRRMASLAEASPYYYTRIESDRACVLGMGVAYAGLVTPATAPPQPFEPSVAGGWCEPEYGAVLHRSPTRLASFTWRAQQRAQGVCQPPDDGHLAEWDLNLAGRVEFLSAEPNRRGLDGFHIDTFDGGFVTCGCVIEGNKIVLPEGWRADESARHWIAFAALPDGHSVVGLQRCRTADRRTYLAEVKGLHLNVPNDLYNEFCRALTTARGSFSLEAGPQYDGVLNLSSRWANVDGRIGAIGLYGADGLAVHRAPHRRGGPYRSLYVDELCWGCAIGTRAVDAGTTILDAGWMVLASAAPDQTRRLAEANAEAAIDGLPPEVRGVHVVGFDGRSYVVVANLGDADAEVPVGPLLGGDAGAIDLATSRRLAAGDCLALPAGHAIILAIGA